MLCSWEVPAQWLLSPLMAYLTLQTLESLASRCSKSRVYLEVGRSCGRCPHQVPQIPHPTCTVSSKAAASLAPLLCPRWGCGSLGTVLAGPRRGGCRHGQEGCFFFFSFSFVLFCLFCFVCFVAMPGSLFHKLRPTEGCSVNSLYPEMWPGEARHQSSSLRCGLKRSGRIHS